MKTEMSNREMIVELKNVASQVVNSTAGNSWLAGLEQAKEFDRVLAGKISAVIGAFRDMKEYLENRGL